MSSKHRRKNKLPSFAGQSVDSERIFSSSNSAQSGNGRLQPFEVQQHNGCMGVFKEEHQFKRTQHSKVEQKKLIKLDEMSKIGRQIQSWDPFKPIEKKPR